MKIEIVIPEHGLRYESLPTEVADVDRAHTAQQIAREMHGGNPFTMLTAAGSVIIPADLMKQAIANILW